MALHGIVLKNFRLLGRSVEQVMQKKLLNYVMPIFG